MIVLPPADSDELFRPRAAIFTRASSQPTMSNSDAILLVTTGLDPVVHAKVRLRDRAESLDQPLRRMDCRVTPGNDEE